MGKYWSQSAKIFQYSQRAVNLVWTTSHSLTIAIAILTIIAGLLPGLIAYLGKLIVDTVILAAHSSLPQHLHWAIGYVGIEAIAVILLAGTQRGLIVSQSLLRVLLGQKVNVLILEKALELELVHFEDPEIYDKMNRARQEASTRPLGLISKTFNIVQNTLTLITYSGLLLKFSVWAVIILALTALPAFIAETRFAGTAFRLFQWRSPETREQHYLETLLAREDYAKEVKLYQLGQVLLERYCQIFDRFYHRDQTLTIHRGIWSYLLGLISTATFYLAYAWIVKEAISNQISLGDMTMYLMVFRQGQSTFANILSSIGGMYEDYLYLSILYEFLEQQIPLAIGNAQQGTIPGDGIRFENVYFTYPGSHEPALKGISFHLKPGTKLAIVGENGSGKTTLIKLLTRLYRPDSGRILLDGLDLQVWDLEILHRRFAVIFQDFVHYQFIVGENVGVGDIEHLSDSGRWAIASAKGMAKPFIESLPQGYYSQLGRWFKSGIELSGGQWQKIALSRAFMREKADILILDEPTAAMDAEAEVQIFHHLSQLTPTQMVILISHRFSTVRMANQILVIQSGVVLEQGTHAELLNQNGRYATLFRLQAQGYQ